ncbi:MAG TPA: phosphate ABC transporter, permease protein PstA, partial [Ureibacillus sp.]|nr:phosphate ABC transporter, permease protein PstA [Ureibacillus sp.]
MKYMNDTVVMKRMKSRLTYNKIWKTIFLLATLLALLTLVVLLVRIVSQGTGYLNMDFFNNFGSRFPEKAGIKAALIGSVYLMLIIAPVSMILGVGTAVYLEEYAKKNKFTSFIKMNISNLAGVPSIVFGLLGLTIFVRMLML